MQLKESAPRCPESGVVLQDILASCWRRAAEVGLEGMNASSFSGNFSLSRSSKNRSVWYLLLPAPGGVEGG